MNRSLLFCSLTLATLLAIGQPAPNTQQPATPTPEELEQIVAPIALYPDALLAQVLMASTYPLEVVLAARWSKEHPDIKGDAVAKAVENETWDASVKSMVAFPDVLTMMNDKLDWTQKLGDAVLAQRADVMSAVQRLRGKAKDAGNLKSSKEQTVKTEAAPAGSTAPQVIVIESPSPPPGYAAGAAFFSFSAGVIVGGALWGGFNGDHSDIDINVNRYNSFNRTNITNVNNINRTNVNNRWEHNSAHRQGMGYRDTATQQRYGRDLDSGNEARDLGNRGNKTRDLGNRSNEYRDLGGGSENRNMGSSSRDFDRDLGGGASGRSSDAFRGVDSGARTRANSSRGTASRGGMSRGGGRRR